MVEFAMGQKRVGLAPTPTVAFVLRWPTAEKIDEELGNAGGFFVLEPVRGVGEGVEFGAVAITQAFVGHVGEEEGVAFAPEDARGDVDRRVRKFAAIAKGGAVPVDHGSESSRL